MSEAPGFGIYLHWPYCSAICPYCDFNVYRARGGDNDALLSAIEADLRGHAERFGKRRAQSLFFGGGTPSLLKGGEIARLIDAASTAYTLDADCEITIEANPEDAHLYAEHVAAGVNRISIGAQALDDAALRALGRQHDGASVLRAVGAAAHTGARVSLDLIYARAHQSVAMWMVELKAAFALPVEHLSLYQLTLEPGTAFALKAERGALQTPDNDLSAALYEATQEACEAAGFFGYEISNHARTTAGRARHNMIYWESGDWLGIGPGSHGRITREGARIAYEAARKPADYIAAVDATGTGWGSDETLTPAQVADEILLMGLRVDEGVSLDRINALRETPINAGTIAWLAEQGFITHERDRIRLTKAGKPLANRISTELAL